MTLYLILCCLPPNSHSCSITGPDGLLSGGLLPTHQWPAPGEGSPAPCLLNLRSHRLRGLLYPLPTGKGTVLCLKDISSLQIKDVLRCKFVFHTFAASEYQPLENHCDQILVNHLDQRRLLCRWKFVGWAVQLEIWGEITNSNASYSLWGRESKSISSSFNSKIWILAL